MAVEIEFGIVTSRGPWTLKIWNGISSASVSGMKIVI